MLSERVGMAGQKCSIRLEFELQLAIDIPCVLLV